MIIKYAQKYLHQVIAFIGSLIFFIKVPCYIVQVHSNGTVCVWNGFVTEPINIRLCTLYIDWHKFGSGENDVGPVVIPQLNKLKNYYLIG